MQTFGPKVDFFFRFSPKVCRNTRFDALPAYSVFHLSGSSSLYFCMSMGFFDGIAAALLMTSEMYLKKLMPRSLHGLANEFN
jgi:hypothetical protein